MGMSHFEELQMRVFSYLEEEDWESAYGLVKTAERNGDPAAKAVLGQFYIHGVGVPEDAERGVELFDEAIAEGCVDAAIALSLIYLRGDFLPQDDRKSFLYALKAAEAGMPEGMALVAKKCLYGDGTETDYAAAYEWGQKAAKLGSPTGMSVIAMMYFEGMGLQKDPFQAAYWFRETLQRDEEGFYMFALAMCLTDPEGEYGITPTQEMLEEAFYWASKGVELGDLDCHMMIGWFYETGNYVNQDYEMAYKYFKLAADNGHEGSAMMLKRYRKNIFGKHYVPQ